MEIRKALDDDDDVDVLDIFSLDLKFHEKKAMYGRKALDDDDVDVLDISSLDSRFHEKKVRPWNKAYSLKAWKFRCT
ncbi:hypothetical protein Tco_0347450 [Tanacetum coccineum]